MTEMGLRATHVVARGISWVQIPSLPPCGSVTLGQSPCLSELPCHLLAVGLPRLAHERPSVCQPLVFLLLVRWCWAQDPSPVVPGGSGPVGLALVRPLGPGSVPLRLQAAGWPPAPMPTWFLPSQPMTRSSWWPRCECSEARRKLQCCGRERGSGCVSSTVGGGGCDTGRGRHMSWGQGLQADQTGNGYQLGQGAAHSGNRSAPNSEAPPSARPPATQTTGRPPHLPSCTQALYVGCGVLITAQWLTNPT